MWSVESRGIHCKSESRTVDKNNEFITSVYKDYYAVIDDETFQIEFDLIALGVTELSPLGKVDLSLAKAGRLTRGQFLARSLNSQGM